jgi:hypothetical protein
MLSVESAARLRLGHVEISAQAPLFCQKALCLISYHSYLTEYKELLKHIYRLHLSRNALPIERIICSIVDEIRLPLDLNRWGRVAVSYDLGTSRLTFATTRHYPYFC